MSLIGGGLGIVAAWMIAEAVAILAGWPMLIAIEAVALALVFSAAVGIIFGLWSAWKASLLHPINALRYE